MNIWQKYTTDEKIVMLQNTAEKEGIKEQAVEKDWWVSIILYALSKTSCSKFLQFKGGTSLSKAWNLIERFSEDIDLSINRSFFKKDNKEMPEDTAQQRTAIRRETFHHVKEILIDEIDKELQNIGIQDYDIQFLSTNSSAIVTVLQINYKSILDTFIEGLMPNIKVEISSMSLNEPYEEKVIFSLIHTIYSEIDSETQCLFKTVLPERTFLEKIFLLNEEQQKNKPRINRMSRHLYDLEKMMDTPFAKTALENVELYKSIVNHRRIFNNILGIDYNKNLPFAIDIYPADKYLDEWEKDYRQLQLGFIYGKSLSFNRLLERIKELTDRIRGINIQEL
jgi:predicted nucleotidyltransferase component of viral defense system